MATDAKLEIILAAKDLTQKTLNTFQARVKKLGKSVLSLQGGFLALAGSYGIGAMTKSLTDTGKQVARLDKAYAEILGSTQAASDEFEFLRQTSDQLGQNFYDMADAYKGLAAASRGTALEGQAVREVFTAITAASASLGLSTDDTRGALNAVQQMMSKGKVSAEELRQQLGERLPGAFNLMAEAVGVSTAELDKMLQQGEVLAADALPKLATVLRTKYTGEVDDATRASNKMAEAFTDLRASMAESGFLDSVSNAMTDIAETVRDPNVQQGLSDMAKNMGAILEALAGMAKYAGLRSVTNTFGQAVELSKQGLLDLTEFARMGFVERQRLVDDILAKQAQLNDGVFTGQIGSDTPGAGTPTLPPVTVSGSPATGSVPSKFDYGLTAPGHYAGAPSIAGVLDPSQLQRAWIDPIGEAEAATVDFVAVAKAQLAGMQVGATDSFMGMADANERAMEMIEEQSTATGNVMKDAFSGWAVSYSQTLTDMLWESELTFDGILESWGKMLTQMVLQQGMSAATNSIFAGIFHDGGVVGAGGVSRSVNPLAFVGAPRLHNGLAADEFPAILQRGETVLPKGTGAGKIQVIVNEAANSPDQGVTASLSQQGDTLQVVVNLVAKNIADHGIVAKSIEGAYGVRRAGRNA